jgi:CRISPR-associated Csx3 family protein
MRVIVLRKQLIEGTPAETELAALSEQASEPKPILLHIVLRTGLIRSGDLEKLLTVVGNHVPAEGEEPVIISGRLPVWVFGALVAFYATKRPWVATFDPRYMEGIVAATSIPTVQLGQHVPADRGSVKEVKEIKFPESEPEPERPEPAEPTAGE